MPSLKSNIYPVLLRLIRAKKVISREFSKEDFRKRQRPTGPPERMRASFDIDCQLSTHKRTIWRLKKRNTAVRGYILYMHGGGYVHNITKYDWPFLEKILQQTDYGIIVPDYPLAPAYSHIDVFKMIVPLYLELIQTIDSKEIVLMGFSAGGGIALALAQYLKKNELEQPGQIILLSPLLDGSLTNPDISLVAHRDPYIEVEGLRQAALAYSFDDNVRYYRVSPINGPIAGLAPISIFMGGRDILMPDGRKLTKLAAEAGVHINYREFPGMIHVWIFLQIPEARQAIQEIIQTLQAASFNNAQEKQASHVE
ncbi:MAG TPA: alpha/beta hydrolase [Chitinophaga sp.]|uniref:alpha/beta hydrolase n=1 Tax=Chitinophaga sp. TaxID=1869181 RepID=UPI002CD0063A|nr:alpha/beta hydrolase [Chitinophaga sp.]HVI44829.1 alpha/beta hydrolase [Chitinophaga sp.]